MKHENSLSLLEHWLPAARFMFVRLGFTDSKRSVFLRTGDAVAMRCHSCPPDAHPAVRVVFEMRSDGILSLMQTEGPPGYPVAPLLSRWEAGTLRVAQGIASKRRRGVC